MSRPSDATTIAKIWPKLTPEQQEWINDLTTEEREVLENLLQSDGAAYVLSIWGSLVESLEYVRTL